MNPYRPFSSEKDAELARTVSLKVNQRTTAALAVIMRMHATDDNRQCIICHVAWPCPTWIAATGDAA